MATWGLGREQKSPSRTPEETFSVPFCAVSPWTPLKESKSFSPSIAPVYARHKGGTWLFRYGSNAVGTHIMAFQVLLIIVFLTLSTAEIQRSHSRQLLCLCGDRVIRIQSKDDQVRVISYFTCSNLTAVVDLRASQHTGLFTIEFVDESPFGTI